MGINNLLWKVSISSTGTITVYLLFILVCSYGAKSKSGNLLICPNVISENNILTSEFNEVSNELNMRSLPFELTSKMLLFLSNALKLKFVELNDSRIE